MLTVGRGLSVLVCMLRTVRVQIAAATLTGNRIHLNLFIMSSIIQWNIRGLQANREELTMLLLDFDPTLVCLQETYHRSDKTASEKCVAKHPVYNTVQ